MGRGRAVLKREEVESPAKVLVKRESAPGLWLEEIPEPMVIYSSVLCGSAFVYAQHFDDARLVTFRTLIIREHIGIKPDGDVPFDGMKKLVAAHCS